MPKTVKEPKVKKPKKEKVEKVKKEEEEPILLKDVKEEITSEHAKKVAEFCIKIAATKQRISLVLSLSEGILKESQEMIYRRAELSVIDAFISFVCEYGVERIKLRNLIYGSVKSISEKVEAMNAKNKLVDKDGISLQFYLSAARVWQQYSELLEL